MKLRESLPFKEKASQKMDKSDKAALLGDAHAKYIKARVLVMIAHRNLVYKRLRTALTIGGVVIGTGAIVFLVSLGLGLQRVVTEQVVGTRSVKSIDVSSSKPKTIRLNSEVLQKIRQYSHVTDVAKTYSYGGKVIFQNASTDSVIYGSDDAYIKINGFKLVAGRSINSQNTNEAMINSSLLKNIGIKDAAKVINQKINIEIPGDKLITITDNSDNTIKRSFTIVGVVDSGASAELFTTELIFSQAGLTDYNQAKVIVDDKSSIPQVRKQIESLAFTTASPADTLDQINQIFSVLNILLAGFGGIGMIIAVLGMFNTLTISLLERTKEIGLLKALGARRRDVRRLFIIEAVTLSFLGGLLGLMVAGVLGGVINNFIMSLAKAQSVEVVLSVFYIPLWLVLATTIFSLIVGYIVVLFPATRAGRINPIDALRRD